MIGDVKELAILGFYYHSSSCTNFKSFQATVFFFFLIFNIYSFLKERERQRVNGGGAEREGDTESEAGCGLRAVGTEPDAGLELKP